MIAFFNLSSRRFWFWRLHVYIGTDKFKFIVINTVKIEFSLWWVFLFSVFREYKKKSRNKKEEIKRKLKERNPWGVVTTPLPVLRCVILAVFLIEINRKQKDTVFLPITILISSFGVKLSSLWSDNYLLFLSSLLNYHCLILWCCFLFYYLK